jgi:hypothetical protein
MLSLTALLAASACVTKSKAQLEARKAFNSGRQKALAEMQQGPVVRILGPVRQPVLPWTEDLTLIQAIVNAGYQGPDPRAILLIRNGEAARIDASRLLGGNDMPLQVGDIIQIEQ